MSMLPAPMTMDEFAVIKTVCAAIGLVIFGGIFVSVTLWVYRPKAREKYENYAKKMLEN